MTAAAVKPNTAAKRGGSGGFAAGGFTAQRQQQAEDAFLEADTDGSGSIDEDECLALFEKLTSNQQADVLAEYMRSFRTSPDIPLDLEFDQFVHVYNSFLEKWGQ